MNSALIAGLLTLFLGVGILAALPPPGTSRHPLALLGRAWFLGLLATGLLLYALNSLHLRITAYSAGGTVLLTAILLFIFARQRNQRLLPDLSFGPLPEFDRWQGLLLFLLLLKIAIVLVEGDCEIRRTDDAFTWSLSLGRHLYCFGDLNMYMKWNYPRLTGALIGWFSLFSRPFNEFSPNFFHISIYLFYLPLLYGLLAELLPPLPRLAAVYLVGSLPLVLTHTFMSGYSDLFLGMLLSLTILHSYRCARLKRRDELIDAAFFAAAMPLIKLEGLAPYLPLALLLMWVAYARTTSWGTPRRVWLAILFIGGCGIGILALIFILNGDQPPAFINPRIYWRMHPENHFLTVLPQLERHLFYTYSTWMLVGPLAMGTVLILGGKMIKQAEGLLFLGGLLLTGVTVYIFCFSPAYIYVMKGTLTNRFLLQQMPLMLVAAMLLIERTAAPFSPPLPRPVQHKKKK